MSGKGGGSQSIEDLERQREEARNRRADRSESESRRKKDQEAAKDMARRRAMSKAKKLSSKSFLSEYGYYLLIAGLAAVVLIGLQYSSPSSGPVHQSEMPAIDDTLISEHNEGDSDYSLAGNRLFDGVSVQESRRLFHNNFAMKSGYPKCPASKDTSALPDSYNWKSEHPQCNKKVLDQGLCSSSWAIVAAGMFTDRFCALTGDTNYRASVQQLLTCEKKHSAACERGYIIPALEYGRSKGFVSEECMKYKPYDISVDCNNVELNKCPQKEHVSDYCAVDGVENIKREIMTNGPVASLMPAYRDFLLYSNGVYNPLNAVTRIDGNQAVKVIGWDTDSRSQYWIVENSFGEDWGQSGIAKIKMSVTDSQLDRVAIAVLPKIASSEETE